MHSLFAALFTLVFSFSHASSLRHSEAVDSVAAASAHYRMQYAPTHRELVQTGFSAASYAGGGCLSCRKMSAAYRLR